MTTRKNTMPAAVSISAVPRSLTKPRVSFSSYATLIAFIRFCTAAEADHKASNNDTTRATDSAPAC
jgi:hypothetical protein